MADIYNLLNDNIHTYRIAKSVADLEGDVRGVRPPPPPP